MGPIAARGRGADLGGLGLPREIDLTPNPTDRNLADLARVLSSAAPRLRAGADYGLPIKLSPAVFRAIPTLPLTTTWGDLNIVARPVGAPDEYDDFLGDASTVELDAVPTLVPTVEALLRGLAGGAARPDPDLLTRLRELISVRPAEPAVIQLPLTDGERRDDLEKTIMETLERLGRPASIRDLLFAMNAYRRPPYKQAKITAEHLHARGWLLRDKEGNAHRYWLNAPTDGQIINDVADLLARSVDPQVTAARALERLGRLAAESRLRLGTTKSPGRPE